MARYDEVIIRNSKNEVVQRLTGGPLSSLKVDGRVVIQTGIFGEERTISVSDNYSIEARKGLLWPYLFLIFVMVGGGMCSCYYFLGTGI